MKINHTRNTVSASTLAELLIVMIISGVVFLLVFDGIQISRKLSIRLASRLTQNNDLMSQYFILEELFQNRDSVSYSGNRLFFSKNGEHIENITLENNRLIVTRAHHTDTLFQQVTKWDIKSSTPPEVDSLFLWIQIGKREIRLSLGSRGHVYRQQQTRISNHEKEHEYDRQ